MTSSDGKTIWLSGNEEINLVTDLVDGNTRRPRTNAAEMLAIQLVYNAYKHPNQWILVSEEFASAKVMNKCRALFEIFDERQGHHFLMEISRTTRMLRIMVLSHDKDDSRMSGYERIITPSPIIF